MGCAGKDKKAAAAPTATTTDATAAGKDKKADAKANVKAAATTAMTADAADKATCETKGDSRTLEIRAKEKGCELAYTKGGTENVVASSQNGKAHCTATLEKIKGRLVEAGFTCK